MQALLLSTLSLNDTSAALEPDAASPPADGIPDAMPDDTHVTPPAIAAADTAPPATERNDYEAKKLQQQQQSESASSDATRATTKVKPGKPATEARGGNACTSERRGNHRAQPQQPGKTPREVKVPGDTR